MLNQLSDLLEALDGARVKTDRTQKLNNRVTLESRCSIYDMEVGRTNDRPPVRLVIDLDDYSGRLIYADEYKGEIAFGRRYARVKNFPLSSSINAEPILQEIYLRVLEIDNRKHEVD